MGLLSMFGAGKDLHHYVSDELLAKDLSGKTAIVTGATGSFGSIVSEALVKQGALVVLAVRRLEAGEVLAAEINSKQSLLVFFVVMVSFLFLFKSSPKNNGIKLPSV